MANLLWEEGDEALRGQLPLVYGLVKDKKGMNLGELMDNFTYKHQKKGYEIPCGGISNYHDTSGKTFTKISKIITSKIGEYMRGEKLDSVELVHSIFYVDGEIRIGDLDHLTSCILPIFRRDFHQSSEFLEFKNTFNPQDHIIVL